MKIHFQHKDTGSRHGSDNYHFTHILGPSYKWYIENGILSFENVVKVSDKKKAKYGFNESGKLTRGIGTITDEGFGVCTVDEDKLAACGKTKQDIIDKINVQQGLSLETMTAEEAIAWMKTFTDYPLKEGTTNTFIISEGGKDPYGEITPEKLLIIG